MGVDPSTNPRRMPLHIPASIFFFTFPFPLSTIEGRSEDKTESAKSRILSKRSQYNPQQSFKGPINSIPMYAGVPTSNLRTASRRIAKAAGNRFVSERWNMHVYTYVFLYLYMQMLMYKPPILHSHHINPEPEPCILTSRLYT